MPQSRISARFFPALVVAAGSAYGDAWHADPISGCLVWGPGDRPAEEIVVSWVGDCDDEGKARGEGVLTWIDDGELGGRYVGPFVAGKASGIGVLYMRAADGGFDRYAGEFDGSEVVGQVTVDTADGTHFVGRLSTTTMSGSGIVTRPSGDRYTGEIENARMHGEGYLERADGERFRGSFREGRLHGQGEWMNAAGDYYRGAFVDGERQGSGRLELADGRVYEGEFAAGQPEGTGRFEAPDGRTIEGRFVAGWPDGEVVVTSATGEVSRETWADGERVTE